MSTLNLVVQSIISTVTRLPRGRRRRSGGWRGDLQSSLAVRGLELIDFGFWAAVEEHEWVIHLRRRFLIEYSFIQPGKPMAYNLGLLCVKNALLWDIVASCSGRRGSRKFLSTNSVFPCLFGTKVRQSDEASTVLNVFQA